MLDQSVCIENTSSGEMETESNNIDSLEVVASIGDIKHELESAAEILTKLELDLACSSKKLVNLDILVMHVASREHDIEAFDFEDDKKLEDAEKVLECDFLYGFLDSELRELESFLSLHEAEIVSSQEAVSSFKHLGDAFEEMEDKLHDCENNLKQCSEQLQDIKLQTANFRRIFIDSSEDEKCEGEKGIAGLDNSDLPSLNAKIKMKTAEQQRNILRMLEKSLAREMNLEKKVAESRQTEDILRLQLQQEVFCMEVEAEDTWQRLFEAENSAEVLLMISKELFGRIQIAHMTENTLSQREIELQSKIKHLNEQLEEKAQDLQQSEISRTGFVEKVGLLEQNLRESEVQLNLLKDSLNQNKEAATAAEKRAETAEGECELLKESNEQLNKDVSLLKSSSADASARIEQLERQLKNSEIRRLHAEASAAASQEKQSMLECTIKDMENLIKDLKSKVLKAERLTESAEDKCIILSDTNAELTEEINFQRHRIQNLEKSLRQADESKKGTAKDILGRSKLIADLVIQLALERDRLHKQISCLSEEKNVAMMYLQQMRDSLLTLTGKHDTAVKQFVLSENDIKNGTSRNKNRDEILGPSATTRDEFGSAPGESLTTESKTSDTVSALTADIKTGDTNSPLEPSTVRNIDARQLQFKHILIVVALVIPALAAFLFQQ